MNDRLRLATPLQIAAYDTVHDHPGGAPALSGQFNARRTGTMSPAVLLSKVDPAKDSHHLMLDEADRLMLLTGDYRILHQLAQNHGHVALALPTTEHHACDMALLEVVARVWEAHGDVGRTVNHALSDLRVDAHEVAQVRQAIYRVQQAMNDLLMRMEGMAHG